MSKFKADTSGANQSSGTSTATKSTVDYEAMNKEVIDILGTQKKGKVIMGFPSGYIDLGNQPRPDFEQLRDENSADQNKAIAESGAKVVTKDLYDNGKMHRGVEVFCNPRTPAKAFTLCVDFPQYEVDKGKFFGESQPAPLRLYMGGDWMVADPDDAARKMRIIQGQMYMTENTNNPQNQWALGTTTTISKMCVAAGLGDDNGLVSKDDITGVLGQPMMFNVQVWNKPAKNDASKSYYTESIKFVGEVPEGLPLIEFNEDLIHGVNFNQPNDPAMLNQVRFNAKNTMKLATDWDTSVIKKEIEQAKVDWKANKDAEEGSSGKSDSTGAKPEAKTNSTPSKKVIETGIDFDDDIPF